MKLIKYVSLFLDKIEEICLAICIIAMIVMNFLNVVCRFLLPQTPFSYTEELTLLLFMWCTMLGIATAFKQHAHAGLSLITDMLPPAIRKFFVLGAFAVSIALMLILIKAGFANSINQITHNQITSGLQISAAWQSMSLPVGGILIVFRCMEVAIQDFIALNRGEGGEEV